MNTYHVTYYYLASGMEGQADTKDYGLVAANSSKEAISIVGTRTSPPGLSESDRNWGLSAKLVHEGSTTAIMQRFATGEPINELMEVNKPMDKLTTQSQFVDVIKNKQAYVVGSVDSNGTMSFSINPTMHINNLTAREECRRLAKVYPGKMFIFVRLSGGELVPAAQTISI